MASAFLARRCFARMDLALAVHLKGFGFWFRCSIHSSIAVLSSVTSLKVPRRMRWRVISAKSRSTRLSQEQDVGVKCSVKRLCRTNQADDVLDLRDEVGIVGDLEAAHQMRLGVFRFGKLRCTEHLRRSEPERLKLWNPHRLLRRQLVRFL